MRTVSSSLDEIVLRGLVVDRGKADVALRHSESARGRDRARQGRLGPRDDEQLTGALRVREARDTRRSRRKLAFPASLHLRRIRNFCTQSY
jgi:hypothetical protein